MGEAQIGTTRPFWTTGDVFGALSCMDAPGDAREKLI